MSKRMWENLLLFAVLLGALAVTGVLILRPAVPQPESLPLPTRQRHGRPRPPKPLPYLPAVSNSQPFDYSVEQLILTNCAARPEQLTARIRLRLLAYIESGTAVSAVIVRLPGYKLQGKLADDGNNNDYRPGDGIWAGWLDTPELPVATDIPLKLESYNTNSKLPQVSEYKIKIAAPAVYPIRFWREPAGVIKPGTKVAFCAEFNQEAKMATISASIGNKQQVVVHLDASGDWIIEKGPRSKLYLGEWLWDKTPCPALGVEHPVSVCMKLGVNGGYQVQFSAAPVVIDAPRLTITGVRFDPAPPLKRDTTVRVIALTDRKVSEGVVEARLYYNYPVKLQNNGRTWTGELRSWWHEGEWGRSKLPCRLSYSIHGVELSSYETQVAIEPLPQPKITSYKRIPAGPVKAGTELDFYVTMDRPMRGSDMAIGYMDIYTGQQPPVMICSLYEGKDAKTGKGDGHWQGWMEWKDKIQTGNWGSLLVRYCIVGPQGSREHPLYETEFAGDELVVTP